MARSKLNLYFGTVKSASGGRHIMAWANTRAQALDMVEAALGTTVDWYGDPNYNLWAALVATSWGHIG